MKEAQRGVFGHPAELMLNLNDVTLLGLNRTAQSCGMPALCSPGDRTASHTQCWADPPWQALTC